jgi:hypothetical protein
MPVSLGDALVQARLSRQLGRFEEALMLLSNHDMLAEAVFERFRVFEDMGELHKCLECEETFRPNVQNTGQEDGCAKILLLKLASAYIGCFVKGDWQSAMELALLAHKDYLSGRTSYDTTMVCAFL